MFADYRINNFHLFWYLIFSLIFIYIHKFTEKNHTVLLYLGLFQKKVSPRNVSVQRVQLFRVFTNLCIFRLELPPILSIWPTDNSAQDYLDRYRAIRIVINFDQVVKNKQRHLNLIFTISYHTGRVVQEVRDFLDRMSTDRVVPLYYGMSYEMVVKVLNTFNTINCYLIYNRVVVLQNISFPRE